MSETEWKPIETAPRDQAHLGVLTADYRPIKLDLYSAKRHIRWPDSGWSLEDGCWYSRHVHMSPDGLRTTTFYVVDEPSHWMPSPFPPPSPIKEE